MYMRKGMTLTTSNNVAQTQMYMTMSPLTHTQTLVYISCIHIIATVSLEQFVTIPLLTLRTTCIWIHSAPTAPRLKDAGDPRERIRPV